jgi:hypothetical protein
VKYIFSTEIFFGGFTSTTTLDFFDAGCSVGQTDGTDVISMARAGRDFLD